MNQHTTSSVVGSASELSEKCLKSSLSESGRPDNNMGLPRATPPLTTFCLKPTIDTIHLSFATTLTTNLATAQKLSTEDTKRAVVECGNWKLRAGTLKGFSGFNTVAVGTGPMEGILLMIGEEKRQASITNHRQVRVVVGSARCWKSYCEGFNGVGIAKDSLSKMDGDAFSVLPCDEAIKVRRLDICIDHWGYNWSIDDLDKFTRKGKSDGVHQKLETAVNEEIDALLSNRKVYRGDKGSTFYIGARGSASRLLRIYNKIIEAGVTGKLPWMEPIWKKQGWNGRDVIWRAEIEHGGDWLNAHGFKSIRDMQGCESELWLNYINDVRHTDGERTRIKRCKSSNVWQSISTAAHRDYQRGAWEWTPRPITEGIDCDKLITQAAGCLLSAENNLGSTPWYGSDATKDDRRSDLLSVVRKSIDKAEEKRTDEAIKHLTRIIDRGSITGDEAHALLALVSQAMETAAGKRLPSQAVKGQYYNRAEITQAGEATCQTTDKQQ